MLKYPCLVLDHDDTVVRSEATVNYPSFCAALEVLRPGQTIALNDFTQHCFSPGFQDLCYRYFGFSDAEMNIQFHMWLNYVRAHVPPAFDGMAELIRRQQAEGGLVCVVSHSMEENILRDYQTHFGTQPDAIFGWECGDGKRKPSPYPLDVIMERYGQNPNQLLMVDHLKPGLDMADSRGVDFAFAGWGRTNVPQVAEYMELHCKHCFYAVRELYDFLFAET